MDNLIAERNTTETVFIVGLTHCSYV